MLEIKNVTAGYGEVQVLNEVTMSIDKGKIIALIGANAAGKTTLLSVISGLIKTTSGEITFDGEKIDTLTSYEIVEKGIVQVPEGRHLFPDMTVMENMVMGSMGKSAKLNRQANIDKVFALLERLNERKDQMAGSLSGGEAQMCAIARGLMADPKILMLDEPSLGLAPKAVNTVLELIQTLKEQGMTILLVEQNVKASLRISDYAYVMENGKIVLEGTGEELLNDERVRKAYLGI